MRVQNATDIERVLVRYVLSVHVFHWRYVVSLLSQGLIKTINLISGRSGVVQFREWWLYEPDRYDEFLAC